MSNLSTLQAATLDAFRTANPGPTGVILEDDQGYFALIRHLTGEPVNDWDQLGDLERRMVVWGINGNRGGFPGFPERIELLELTHAYLWCFILFQATFGRDDIAVQIDRLLDAGQPLDRLILANYQLDQTDAKDDLRRLFALVPTVKLYFANAEHLFEIDADDTINPAGARQVAKLFALMREAGLPGLVTTYREYRRSLDELGACESPSGVVSAVRRRLAGATDMLFEIGVPWLPPKQEFDRTVDRVTRTFLADPN